jgi:ribonuclease HI
MKTFYIHGAGPQSDGRGCGYSWVRTDKKVQRIEHCTGLTHNQSTYWALIDVLRYLAPGSHALIFTSSQLLARQFSGEYRIRKEDLLLLSIEKTNIIDEKELDIEVRWTPRERNIAADLFERSRRLRRG